MPLTNAQLAILGLVSEGPRYGYQIEQDIERRGMREWTEISFSSIYYLLNKLEEQGLLVSRVEAQAERPNRKVYELSEVGKSAYNQAVADFLARPRPRSGDFDLGLANLPALSQAEALAALEEHRTDLAQRIDKIRHKWSLDRHPGGLPLHVEALFDHSITHLQTELEWVERWITRFKEA